jgi:hypothetical protein
MIYCKELKQEFETKGDLFKALAENETLIVDAKKAEIYKSIDKGLQIVTDQKGIKKALNSEENKALKFDDNYYYFVVNSANILDSHKDVHLKGNWNKTVKDQQGKVYLIWHHNFENKENIIAFPEDIEMFTAEIPFSLLGRDYEGNSYCLIYKVLKSNIQSDKISKWLELGKKLQLSVRMRYVKVITAFKSDNPDYFKQNEAYEEIYPLIANKEDFQEDIIYFFGVKEAQNVLESSILPFGSNSTTGSIQENKEEAELITSEIKEEPTIVTQIVKRKLSVI